MYMETAPKTEQEMKDAGLLWLLPILKAHAGTDFRGLADDTHDAVKVIAHFTNGMVSLVCMDMEIQRFAGRVTDNDCHAATFYMSRGARAYRLVSWDLVNEFGESQLCR